MKLLYGIGLFLFAFNIWAGALDSGINKYQKDFEYYPIEQFEVIVHEAFIGTRCYVEFQRQGVPFTTISPSSFDGNRMCRSIGANFNERKSNSPKTLMAFYLSDYESNEIAGIKRGKKIHYLTPAD